MASKIDRNNTKPLTQKGDLSVPHRAIERKRVKEHHWCAGSPIRVRMMSSVNISIHSVT